MNTYNVYLGKDLIMENVDEYDLEHKLVFVKEYFDWYRDEELAKKKLKVCLLYTSDAADE